MDKKDRFGQAYNHLRSLGLVHTQKDLADALESTGPNISRALKGDPKVLTDNLCLRLTRAFDIISYDWLIDEKGSMLAKSETKEMPVASAMPDQSSMINAMLAAKDEAICALKSELARADKQIAAMQRQLDDKDEIIALLKAKVVNLDSLVAKSQANLLKYPFPIGVADDGSIEEFTEVK